MHKYNNTNSFGLKLFEGLPQIAHTLCFSFGHLIIFRQNFIGFL